MNTQKLKRWVLPISLGAVGLILIVVLICLLVSCNGTSKIEKAFVLSETEFSLMAGNTKTLTLENPENKDVGDYTLAWMTENSAVATVKDDGVVTGVAPGTTKITVAVRTEKVEVYFNSTVTVTENLTPLTSISFNTNVYSLGEGQTINLYDEVVYYPTNAANKNLTWTSSNPDIATVADGIVTPVSEGISTITAATADGTISATCMVRISEITVDPTGISFDEEEYSITEGETLRLTANVEPTNATGYSILWTSSDAKVATVTGGVVTAVSPGNATITARLNVDGGRMSAQCIVTVDPAGDVIVSATKVQITPSSMTIPENQNGPFKFGITVSPANCTEEPVWTTNRADLLKINASTGEFTVIKAPTDTTASVVVTCTVGDVSSTAVVNISPRKPTLEIVSGESDTLYDKAPLNTLELVAAYTGSNDLPEVTWASSDPTVATVDATGLVTGHKAGTCTITAISKTDSSVGAKYTVTVQKANYVTVTVGQTVAIDKDLIPKNVTSQSYNTEYLELNKETMTVKGLKESSDKPVEIVCIKTDGTSESIYIYILSAQQ